MYFWWIQFIQKLKKLPKDEQGWHCARPSIVHFEGQIYQFIKLLGGGGGF